MQRDFIYVWSLDWHQYLYKKHVFWGLLSEEEQKKVQTFISPADRDKSTITRGLLRTLIGNLLLRMPHELSFEYNRFGKPALKERELLFSVSHSRNKVLYAFSKNKPIGIDVEYQKQVFAIKKLAKRYFSPCENQVLMTLQGEKRRDAFFRGWVQKEAVVKALGLGLKMPLREIEVQLSGNTFACVVPSIANRKSIGQVLLYPILLPHQFKGSLAVCTTQDKRSIKLNQFDSLSLA